MVARLNSTGGILTRAGCDESDALATAPAAAALRHRSEGVGEVDALGAVCEAHVNGAPDAARRLGMAGVERIAPIFPVQDLERALEHYRRLGFDVRTYAEGVGYGFAVMGDAEIHLGVPRPGVSWTPSSAYLFVEDADELAARWRSSGAEVHAPEETQWGRREGAIVDPDGNVIRFGSPSGS